MDAIELLTADHRKVKTEERPDGGPGEPAGSA